MRFFPTRIALIILVGPIVVALDASPAAPKPLVKAGSQSAGPGGWSEKARLGEQRTESGVVAVNGKVYVLGGMARGADSSALNQEYDPATDRWRERAPMPGPLSHPGAVAVNGRIYVVGGFLRNVHLDAQDAVFEFDVANDRWRTLARLSSPRGSVGVAALNGRIHAIGGRDVNRVTVAVHEVFDPRAGTWTALAPLPRARDHAAVIAANGRIHVIGGRFDTPAENTALHDVYDAEKNAWTPATPMTAPRSGGAVVLDRGRILVVGGECDTDTPFVANEAFDVKTGRWSTLAPMLSGRHGIQAAVVGQVLYVPGGAPVCRTGVSDTLLTFRLPT